MSDHLEATSRPAPDEPPEVTGHLSRSQLVGLALASYVPPVGLAAVPALILTTAGNGSWLGALIAAFGTSLVGLSIISFARRYVVTGSLYSYISHVFGPWARILTGAALFLGYVAQVGAIAFLVGLFSGSFLLSVGVGSGFDIGVQMIIYSGAVLIAAAIAYRGLGTSVRSAVTLATVSVPLMVVVTVAAAAHSGLDLGAQLSFEGATTSGIFQGVAAGAVFLVGFESSTALAAETRDAKRAVPLAVMCVPAGLGALYVVATFLQVPALTAASDALAAGTSPAAALAIEGGLGSTVATATDLVLAIATFAALIGFVNYGSRFVATLATDRLLPARTGRIHPRHRSPATAVVTISVLGLGAILVMAAANPDDIVDVYNSVATLIVYFWVIPYLLICAGAVKLLAREGRLGVTAVVSAVAGAAAMAWMYLNGLINPPAAPLDAMSYVALVALAAVFAVFLITHRLTSAPASDDTHH
ncbi:amino acid permease [Amycolatopsis deserti]|uniref:Amino acid permease n=1 Tax=Amycolatopsis deserti TaxID=185696 RepID=A0ABQ3IBP8_9PSEU|nr:APC family permease [Amycolatopsis deserti]GHE75396.1 amino acid permease [Amycolatopsis deserti]